MKISLTSLSLFIVTTLLANELQAGPNPKLDEIFTQDMLGSDVAYLQQFTGIPKLTSSDTRNYRVGKCNVTAYISGDKVDSLELEVTPECTFDLSQMIYVSKGTYAHRLTYGILPCGHFTFDCFLPCGNWGDPSVYMTLEGSRAENLIQARYETVLASDQAIDAFLKWQSYIQSKERTDTLDENVNDGGKYDDAACRFFENVPITWIRIGYGINEN